VKRPQESFKLAEALGLNGTPSYVIGDNVLLARSGSRHSGEGQHLALRQAELLTGAFVNRRHNSGRHGILRRPFLREKQ
jgi:hypothetical protein